MHGISPCPFSQHQGNLDEFLVGIFSLEMSEIDFAFLEMSFVALRQVQRLSQSLYAPRAVPTIPLEVAVSQAVLGLKFPY